jgi:tetratricopeptide (TPR) repeat protein
MAEGEMAFLLALKNHARVQEELGNFNGSIEALQKLDMLSPIDVDRKIKLGELFLKTGNQEKASAVLEKALTLAREFKLELGVKERIKELLNESEKDDPDYRKVQENPHDLAACNEFALRLRKKGRFHKAEECYDFILTHHPNHPVVLYNKAVLYIVQERFEEAEEILAALAAEKPFAKALETLEMVRKRLSSR